MQVVDVYRGGARILSGLSVKKLPKLDTLSQCLLVPVDIISGALTDVLLQLLPNMRLLS